MSIFPLPPLGHRFDYTVRTADIDRRKQLTVPALLRVMQEAAMQNVLRIRLSVWDLEPHGISWVLVKFRLEVERLPGLGESLTVSTYPAGFEKYFTYRDYYVHDADGRLLARGSSQWLLMDTATRKMTRIPEFITAHAAQMTNRADWLPHPARRLPATATETGRRQYLVDYYDLDFNGHLNNAHYFRWMLEALPLSYLTERPLRSMEVHFRAEAYHNDTLQSTVAALPDSSFRHALLREGQELAIGHTVFE